MVDPACYPVLITGGVHPFVVLPVHPTSCATRPYECCPHLFFRVQRPPLAGWSAVASQVALTYTATIVVLATTDAGRPALIRSPQRLLAHCWEGLLYVPNHPLPSLSGCASQDGKLDRIIYSMVYGDMVADKRRAHHWDAEPV
jgi:hypothetical protein